MKTDSIYWIEDEGIGMKYVLDAVESDCNVRHKIIQTNTEPLLPVSQRPTARTVEQFDGEHYVCLKRIRLHANFSQTNIYQTYIILE